MGSRFNAWSLLPQLFERSLAADSPSSSSFSTRTIQPQEDGLENVIASDLAQASVLLFNLVTRPSGRPHKALRLADNLLRPSPTPDTNPSSPSAGSSSSGGAPHAPRGPAISRQNQTKAAVALLLGLSVLCAERERDAPDQACLEDLLQSLVGIFVKGGVRAPAVARDQLLPDDLVRSVGAELVDTDGRDSWSVWRLSEHLIGRIDGTLPTSTASADPQLVRTRINIAYLQALFASSSSAHTAACAHSTSLFTECIRLGSLIGIHGALPGAPVGVTAQEAHVSSLIWKSRKRLELSGHVDVALSGLPDGGQSFDRWSGGAAEKTRQAEEAQRLAEAQRKRRKDLARGRTPSQQRLYSLRIDDGVDDARTADEGEMLAPPLRLKGKKLAHRRKGSYEPSMCSPTSSSSTSLSTLATPSSSVSLRHPDCFLYHQSYTQSTPSSPGGSPSSSSTQLSRCRDHSTTSLPSLERRQSIHLLRTPPPSPGRLPPSPAFGHQTDLSSPLKSPVPRPLPTLLDSQAIFAISPCQGGPVYQFASDDDIDNVEADAEQAQPSTWLQTIRQRVSTLSLRRKPSAAVVLPDPDAALIASSHLEPLLVDTANLPPLPPFFRSSSSTSSSLASPAPSLCNSLSSESTVDVSPPVRPQPLNIPWRVPAIGFTPSSHDAGATTAEDALAKNGVGPRRGGILRSFSPVPSRLNTNVRRRQ